MRGGSQVGGWKGGWRLLPASWRVLGGLRAILGGSWCTYRDPGAVLGLKGPP